MTEGTDQPQRYCRNCGAELRPGKEFCVSCGARIENEPERVVSDSGTDWDFYHQSSGGVTSGIHQRLVAWFKNLPSVSRVVVVGLVLLALVVLGIPLLQLVAGIVLAVSIIAILLGLSRGKAVRGWVITGSVSLVLALTSLYFLGTPYDTGSGGDVGSGSSSGGPTSDSYSEADYLENAEGFLEAEYTYLENVAEAFDGYYDAAVGMSTEDPDFYRSTIENNASYLENGKIWISDVLDTSPPENKPCETEIRQAHLTAMELVDLLGEYVEAADISDGDAYNDLREGFAASRDSNDIAYECITSY